MKKIKFLLLQFCLLSYASAQNNGIISTNLHTLKFDPVTGSLVSFIKNKRELVFKSNKPTSLFNLRLRNEKGDPYYISALEAQSVIFTQKKNDTAYVIEIRYVNLKNTDLNATASVICPFNSPLTYWYFSVENQTKDRIDHIDYPYLAVPNDLVATGGDAKIFRPSMEGVLVDDVTLREDSWLSSSPLEYPSTGWVGYYPASCPMQFMAYYGKDAGLYFASHDKASNIKGLEYYNLRNGGIQLKIRLFPGGIGKGKYTIPYPIVLGGFTGDWYDAADIYREWLHKNVTFNWTKLLNNKALPSWFETSPIVASYPVRGTKDLGEMKTNEEYYPYANALPIIDSLNKAFGSKIMALLMHWESTAPWAPPYVWPPMGGEAIYNTFVKSMHAKGNVVGLYASGTGYSVKSNIVSSYNKEKEFQDKNLKDVMCIAPDGKLANNGVCAGEFAQRVGYDMCPSNKFVKDVLKGEMQKILTTETDYVQFFDQNLGGLGYFCYSDLHGHAKGPGIWMKEEMLSLYKDINKMIEKTGKKVLLGCEAAAAEPFIPYLLFNDLRYPINYGMGTPVPAYAYVFHEYVNNFMGNQNSFTSFVNIEKSPLNFQQKLAYSFCAGDLFTVVLGDHGNILWDWPTPWYGSKPDQTQVKTLIKNLNAWRTGKGKPYLVYGKMEKPLPLEGTTNIPMISIKGKEYKYPSILTSKWKSQDGKHAQVLVNYTTDTQTCKLTSVTSKTIQIYTNEASKKEERSINNDGTIELTIPALSAVMIEINE